MTHILAYGGRRVEILEFYQFTIFEATVTMIYATHGRRKVWTVGFGSNPDISAANSLVNAANRLYPTVNSPHRPGVISPRRSSLSVL